MKQQRKTRHLPISHRAFALLRLRFRFTFNNQDSALFRGGVVRVISRSQFNTVFLQIILRIFLRDCTLQRNHDFRPLQPVKRSIMDCF